MHDAAARAGQADDLLGEARHGHFARVADVDGIVGVRLHEPQDAVHEIADVAEAARLPAAAVDGQVFPAERLGDEVGDRPAVPHPHAGPVGVEDPDDLRVQAVTAAIGGGDGLGEALGLVVDPARPDRVDVAPVLLGLRMLQGVAVDFGRRGEDELGLLGLGQTEGVVRAQRAHLEGRDRPFQIVDGAGRAGPVQHHLDRPVHADVVGHVVPDEPEVAVGETRDVRRVAGGQVVDADDGRAAVEQGFGQMRSDEAGDAGDDDAIAHGGVGVARAEPPGGTRPAARRGFQ